MAGVYLPIVQMGESHDSMKDHPVGQVVRLAVEAKIQVPLFREVERPMGSAMIVATIRTKFITTNAVCILPMILLKLLARIPWDTTHARKTA